MKQISFFLTFWVTVLLLSACSGKNSTASGSAQGDTIPLHYSANLSLIDYEDYIVAQLRNPWDTAKILHTYVLVDKKQPLPHELPQGTLVRTPLSKAVIYSSVHCSLLKDFGDLNSIGGVCDLKYIKLPEIEEGCRNGRVEKLNVPIIECADYMETSSLGRAEWMRFYGLLFGKKTEADAMFASIERNYKDLQELVKPISFAPSVMCDLKISSTWYTPGGNSTIAKLYSDAGANYIFREDTHSGSLPYPFEVIFEKGQQTDFWLIRYNQPVDKTYGELEKEFAPYAGFRAFKERNIYGCNTNRVPFYEETPFHPDWLLKDLIKIFHPSLLEGYELRYYNKLAE